MSDQNEREREYGRIEYRQGVWSDDIGGFAYEKGRYPDEVKITEKAVVPGDSLLVWDDGTDIWYRAVEVGEDRILAYNKSNDSMELELVEWGEIDCKSDPHTDYIDDHDEWPDEIKMVRDPSDE